MRNRWSAAFLAVLVGGLASGCGSDGGSEATAVGPTIPSEVAADEATDATDPRILAEEANQPDDEAFAFGQQLSLTDAGPVPKVLVVIAGEPLTIRNDGTATITLDFLNGTVGDDELAQTPPIPPGESFEITPTRAVSVRYGYLERPEITGNLQVDTGDFEP